MDDLAQHTNAPQQEAPSPAEAREQRASLSLPRRLLRGFGIFLVVIAVLLGVYGTVAYAAWQRGQSLQIEQAQQAQEEQIANQINLARGDIADGNFALATRRLEWVLERAPDSVEAQTLHEEAQNGLNARLAPTAIPSPTPTPEIVETSIEGDQSGEAAANAAFADLETLMRDNEWEAAISAIAAFQRDFPNERRHETDEMLYNAYINLGMKLSSGAQIELGLFYLGQAERLGDLPPEAEDQRTWAELYLEGIGYYGVNWETTIFYFRGLCSAAPFYQDACQKLFDAYVAYGDQYAAALDWCPAEEWYTEALQLETVTAVVEKRREAATNCLEATPTSNAPATITGTAPITNTVPTAPATEASGPQ